MRMDRSKKSNANLFQRLEGVFLHHQVQKLLGDSPWHIQGHIRTNKAYQSRLIFFLNTLTSLSSSASPQSQRLVKRQIFNHWQLVKSLELGTSALPCMLKSVPWGGKKNLVQLGKNVYHSQLLILIWKFDVLMTKDMIINNKMEICWKRLKIIHRYTSDTPYSPFSGVAFVIC